MSNKLGRKIYAVKKGIQTGIFHTWEECEKQVKGVSGAEYKSFTDMQDALSYLQSPSAKRQARLDKDLAAVMNLSERRKPSSFYGATPGVPFAFVDGSFNPDTGVYGYGGFLCAGDSIYKLQGSGNDAIYASMRNVAGEILGARAAVMVACDKGLSQLIIHHDYEGLSKWVSGEWKAKTSPSVDYVNFMSKAASLGLDIMFTKEDAHTISDASLTWGKINNERADILAKRAVGLDDLADTAERRLNRLLRARDMTVESLSSFDEVYDCSL